MAVDTQTGGRSATSGQIDGRYSLSVGRPEKTSPSGWEWRLLTDLARLETGHTPSRKHPEYWDGDIPWIGIKDATSNHGLKIADTYQHATQIGIDNSSARVLPANTVCLSRTASVGYVVVMGRPMATSQDFVNWVCGDQLDYNFLKYILLSERDSFLRFASGTTHQTIYFPEVKAFHVCLPCLREQKAIAHVLGTLDDKIELNRKTNETLEGIAQVLFKSWFVDFDPVRAKAEGRPTGLPDEISELFPDSFEESELGEIPSGWSWQPLGDLITLDKGVSYKGAFLSESEGVPMVNLGCFAGAGKFREEKMKFYMGDYKDRHLASSGDIFVANTDMTQNRIILGSPVVMPRWKGHEKYLFSHHVFALRLPTEAKIWSGFIYQSLLRPEFRQIASGYATGTTVLALPKDGILEFRIPKMPIHLIHSFNGIFQPIVERIESAVEINRTLIELRDALLPRLISGELRVPDAEKMLEEAGV